ncbi:unnamed protein product [Owenia fusiformis]|uniref:TIR domain-containing protein n=1 Tax=Owenia fusiformis TaxID=6347 RepID=A0A8S4PT12_OWEFU|nr:unnamed protein product [Owenia fusiformis]
MDANQMGCEFADSALETNIHSKDNSTAPEDDETDYPEDLESAVKSMGIEVPIEYSMEELDYVIYHSDKDIDLAEDLNRQIQLIGKSYNINGSLYQNHSTEIQSNLISAEHMVNRSTFILMIVSENFTEDIWMDMHKDEVLTVTMIDPTKRWCLIPVFTKPKSEFKRLPYGMLGLKGIYPNEDYFEYSVHTLFGGPRAKALKEERIEARQKNKMAWLKKAFVRGPDICDPLKNGSVPGHLANMQCRIDSHEVRLNDIEEHLESMT